jgi:hypothetical protein
MVICGSLMHKFSVIKDIQKRKKKKEKRHDSREGGGAFMSNTNYMKKINNDKRRRDMVVGKVVAHLCLSLIIKEFKFSVEHDRVVTTLNKIKH